MSQRSVVSLCVFAAATGIAFIMIAGPGSSRLISPGPLISAHRQVVDRCEDCHAIGTGKLSDWVHTALDSQSGKQQSALCLECHGELGVNALHRHGQSLSDLQALTEHHTARASDNRSLEVVVARTIFGSPATSHAELACATCHREHHGAIDLTSLTNHQCQVCHTGDFHSFGKGHPELANYPYDRRTRIYFDHQTHFGSHFSVSQHACSDCHMADVANRYMLVKGFEETCAKCHARQIEDDSLPGLLVAAVPAIDVESLRAAGTDVGQWPSIYPKHVEARSTLAPLYALIAPLQDDLQGAQTKLKGIDLADLSDATPAQRQLVAALIWAFKESLVDVLEGGRAGMEEDLATRQQGRLSDKQLKELVDAIPLEGLASMQREWLPNVVQEVAARRAEIKIPDSDDAEPDSVADKISDVAASDRRKSRLLNSGWFLHSPSMSLRYRATRHADPFLKTLLDLSVSAKSEAGNVTTGEAAVDPFAVQLNELYDSLASPFANGRCTKCHSVDVGASGDAHLNWLTYNPPLAQHAFTHFNHAPHLTRHTNEACSKCHKFSPDGDQENTILRRQFVTEDWQPRTFAHNFNSDFAQMSKSTCAKCHTRQSARDRCTTCHNYHVR
jgi:hypothetical protein